MTDARSLDDYLAAVAEARDTHPDYREGQAFFVVLSQLRPELAERIVRTPLDPFSVDARVGDFLGWLEEHW